MSLAIELDKIDTDTNDRPIQDSATSDNTPIDLARFQRVERSGMRWKKSTVFTALMVLGCLTGLGAFTIQWTPGTENLSDTGSLRNDGNTTYYNKSAELLG